MKKNLKYVILGVFMIALVVGFYFYISNKRTIDDVDESTTKPSAVQKLINRNLDEDCPPTPKEVCKFYADITTAFYTKEYTDEEFEQMAMKMRDLFDDELKAANPKEYYVSSLKQEITDFKGKGYMISSYATSAATDVDFFKDDGFEFARLNITFTVRAGSNIGLSKEIFLLRRDEAGHYKIYGWKVVPAQEEE